MRWLSTLLLWPVLAFAGMPTAPAELDLSAEERALVADRDVAIRLDTSDSGGMSTGIIDINATPSQTMAAVLDLPPRVDETGSLREIQVYGAVPASGEEPETLGARYGLRVFGTSIVFHVNYQIDRDALWTVASLDESRENDLVSMAASYQVFPTATGSRLIYRTQSDSGRSVPGWIKSWLANNALKDQLNGIRTRAEET